MGGSASTLSDPNSDISKIYTNISNSTANLSTKTDITNATSNLLTKTDLTNATSSLVSKNDLTGLTSGLTGLTSGLTNATTNITNATTDLAQAAQTSLASATSNLATAESLSLTNTKIDGIQSSVDNIQKLTNVVCPTGYRYMPTLSLQATPNTPIGPYCTATPYKTLTVTPPPVDGNTTVTPLVPPIAICPYGDVLYTASNIPMCVIPLTTYQQSACMFGVASTAIKKDAANNSYQVTTCKAAP